MPTNQARLLDERIPNSRLVIIPRANHIVMTDQPAALVKELMSF